MSLREASNLQEQYLDKPQVIMITGCKDSGRYLFGQCLKYTLKLMMADANEQTKVSLIDQRRAEKDLGITSDLSYESMAHKAIERANRGQIVILTGLCNQRSTRVGLLSKLGGMGTEIYLEGSHKPQPPGTF